MEKKLTEREKAYKELEENKININIQKQEARVKLEQLRLDELKIMKKYLGKN